MIRLDEKGKEPLEDIYQAAIKSHHLSSCLPETRRHIDIWNPSSPG